MTKFTIQLDKKQLNDALQKIFRKKLDILGYLIVNEIQDNIKSSGIKARTGNLMGRIHHKVEGNNLFIMDGTKYGVHLEFGTTRHFIKPRSAKKLGWRKDGKPSAPGAKNKTAFSKGHWVKGIMPYSFFRKTLFSSIRMRKLVNEAFSQ